MSNGWSDWHHIWYTCVDSSGNGYTSNKLPLETQGGTWGVLGGQTFKSQGKLSNGWTDWHQLWFTSADSSGNGHRLNTSHPSIPQGACRGGLGGHTFKSLGKLQTAGPIGTKCGTRLWIHLGKDIGSNNSPHDTPGRHCDWFYGINNSKDWESVVKRLDGLGINFAHIMQMNLGMDKCC